MTDTHQIGMHDTTNSMERRTEATGKRRAAFAAFVALLLVAVTVPATGSSGSDPIQWEDSVEPSRVIIHFTDGVPSDIPTYISDVGGKVVMAEDYLPFIVVSIDPEDSLDLIERAQADDRVAAAEYDRYVYPMYTPNDLLKSWSLNTVDLPGAWDITLGDHNVSLHILDTGIDHTHLDLMENLSPVCDGPTALGRTTMVTGALPGGQETGFHGTHVAGIAGAVINNTLGVPGASQSCMTSVQVLAAESGLVSWVASGIAWSANNGADIISLSLGGPVGTYSLEWAVDHAYLTKGALVVAAAGNDGCSASVGFPAAYDNAMAVAALGSSTGRASYSTCGPEVEITAPGSSIWSTLPGNTYGPLSGTSMATPLVSGIAGLMMAHNSALTNVDARCILTSTADDLGPSGHDSQHGWGRVDASAAVAAAANPSSVGC